MTSHPWGDLGIPVSLRLIPDAQRPPPSQGLLLAHRTRQIIGDPVASRVQRPRRWKIRADPEKVILTVPSISMSRKAVLKY